MAETEKPTGPVTSEDVPPQDPKPKAIRQPPSNKMLTGDRIAPGYKTKG